MNRSFPIAVLALLLSACGGLPVVLHSPFPESIAIRSPEDRTAAFAAAYKLFQKHDYQAAVVLFDSLQQTYPELADYHLYFYGAGQRRLGNLDEAESALRRLRREFPQSTRASAAALELGLVFLQGGQAEQARPLLQIAQAGSDADQTATARFHLADLDERAGEFQAAYAGFLEVRRSSSGTSLGRKAKKRIEGLRAQYPVLDPVGRGIVDEAKLLLTEGDHRAAKVVLERLLLAPANVRGNTEESEILRLLADAFYGIGDIDRTLSLLRNLGERYPNTSAAASASYRRATILWNRDRDNEALDAFAAFVERYPRNERAAEGLYAIGRIHQQAGHSSEAIDAYSRMLRQYPSSSLASEARWRIGWVHYRNQRFDAAISAFAGLASQSKDDSRDGAFYWQARSLERLGKSALARDLYQRILRRDANTYYALWAERRLNSGERATPPNRLMVDTSMPTPPNLVPPTPPAVADRFHVDRAIELQRIGVFDLARAELSALAQQYPDDRQVDSYLFDAYPSVDAYNLALRRIRQASKQRAELSPRQREQLLYPLAFWTLVEPRSQTYGVDPLLIQSLMRQESLFDPRAHSPANARGLMQLLPSTAKRVAGAGDDAEDIDLYDPETNVELGTRYFRSLLLRFDYDPFKAIASYNGGENAVDRWQRRYGDLETDEFVESITYRETRDYVKKVVGNYRKYSSLYRPG